MDEEDNRLLIFFIAVLILSAIAIIFFSVGRLIGINEISNPEDITIEKLRGLNNCLYYEPGTNSFYKSVCIVIDEDVVIYE